MKNDDNWWDFGFLLQDLAERLLHDAAQFRKFGSSTNKDEIADEMEECAWAMLSADSNDDLKNDVQIEKFTSIMRKYIRGWWD